MLSTCRNKIGVVKMNFFKSLCVAFSMYSKIPMPKVSWEEKNLKYALCFFPLVGVVIGVCDAAVFCICSRFGFSDILRAALMTAAPVIISGGIHTDGFMDTTDALASYADRDKKLKILKDPHIGAFAVIGAVVYFLLYFAFLYEADTLTAVFTIGIGFVLSRALSALAICHLKCAKNSGLLHIFKNSAQRAAVKISSWIYIALSVSLMLFADCITGAVCVFASVAALALYRRAASEFGGITGDVAGWFVCVCELFFAAAGGVICVLL